MSDSHHSTSNTQEMWTAAVCWEGAFTMQTCWGPVPSSQPVILGRLLLWPGHTHAKGHMQESRQMLTYGTRRKGMYRLKAQILYISLPWCSVVRLLFTYKYDVEVSPPCEGATPASTALRNLLFFPLLSHLKLDGVDPHTYLQTTRLRLQSNRISSSLQITEMPEHWKALSICCWKIHG